MKDLLDLLQAWSEHEPERCRYDAEDKEWCVLTPAAWSCMPNPNLCAGDVQWAVQHSIEAQGWSWMKIGGALIHVRVGDGEVSCYKGDKELPWVEDLLTAYLAALEAVKTQEVA